MALEKSDLALILRAAQRAGIDPGKLRDENPWSCSGPVAMGLQAAVADLDPAASERLQAAAGVGLSLGARAALEGLAPWTAALEAELQTKAPATYERLAAEHEEAVLQASVISTATEDAERLAAEHGYNVALLQSKGHHAAAAAAARHNDRLAAEQARDSAASWYRAAAR